MKDGLYKITITASGQSVKGVLTIRGTTISGGDSAAWWNGSLHVNGAELSGHAEVHQEHTSDLLIPLPDFDLTFKGVEYQDSAILSGEIAEAKGLRVDIRLDLLKAH